MNQGRRRTVPANGNGTISISALMGFPDVVSELGGNAASLIAKCGLNQRVFDDHEATIPFSAGACLLQMAAQQTRCPHFGLGLGQRQNIMILGLFGLLIQNSPDVRTALLSIHKYHHLHAECLTSELLVEGKIVKHTHIFYSPGIAGVVQMYYMIMGCALGTLRLLSGSDFLPTAVHFSSPAPQDITPFGRVFQAPVLFGQPSNSMFFPASYLDRPISNADPHLRNTLQNYIDEIEAQHEGDFHGQVRRVIRTLLPMGTCTIERVASLFSMHRRTLYRYLNEHNTTFEQMMDTVRYEISGQMLQESNSPLTKLASMVGYHNSSAFIRAFLRWSGITPTAWRKKHRADMNKSAYQFRA